MLKEFLWNAFIKAGHLEAYGLYRELPEKSDKKNNEYTFNEEIAIEEAAISKQK